MHNGLLTHGRLLERAASAGEPLTLKELLRWRRQDLLPPARRVPRGSLGGKKHLAYPPETEFVVLALCRLRSRFRYHPSALAIALWAEGYDLPWSRVHQALRHVMDPLLPGTQPSQADPLARVLEGAQRVSRLLGGRKLARPPFSRHVRSKPNPEPLGLASLWFSQMAAGQLQRTRAPLDERAQDRLLVHWLTQAGEYLQGSAAQQPEWCPFPLEVHLSRIKRLILDGAFALDRFFPDGTVITTAQLEQARADYHRCLLLWQRLAGALEFVVGAAVLRHEGFRLWREDPWIQGWALLMLLRMRVLGCEPLLEELEGLFVEVGEPVAGMAVSREQWGTRWHALDTTAPSA